MPNAKEKPKKQSPEKFRSMAAAMQKQIDAKLDPAVGHQRMTRRRAMMASSANNEGRRLLEVQQRLLAMAEALENGTLPEPLRGITSRAQVERLTRYERFPEVFVRQYVRNDVFEAAAGAPGVAELKRKVPDVGEHGDILDHEGIEAFGQLLKIVHTRRAGRWFDNIVDSISEYRRIYDAGIRNEEEYSTARGLLLGLQQHGAGVDIGAVDRDLEIKMLERTLVGINIPGYFPTPRDLAAELVSEAGIGDGMKILEPSAGKGDILDAIAKECSEKGLENVKVDAIEINGTLCAVLEKKGHEVTQGDFLERCTGGYDRIIMNPPFENGQDIEHVRRAYELLNPGGRVAAIMSEGPFFRNDRKAGEFREWLELCGGQAGRNTSGAFYDSDRPTGVATRIVVITKWESYSPEIGPEMERIPENAVSPGM